MGAPAGKSPDLRVVRLPDDDGLPPFLLRLGHQLLDAAHVGTGGVDTGRALLLQCVQDLFQFPVGPDDDRVPRSQCTGLRRLPDAPPGQILHHMGVVDQVSQHPAAARLLRGPLGKLYRPPDAVAKTGALRQDHTSTHSGFPPTAWPPRA